MTAFYLQHGLVSSKISRERQSDPRTFIGHPEPRTFLDDVVHPDASVIQTIEAENWITARSKV
jgi:hypothetical protein